MAEFDQDVLEVVEDLVPAVSAHEAALAKASPEQREVIQTWGKGLAVMAGAGSGKTTTLVTKCIELMRRNPEARFAAVSFTERSANDLRAKLSERLDGAMSGHWVMTIHGLCGTILREFPREAGFDGEERMLSEPESKLFWERAIDGLWHEELPEEVRSALERLLSRESRDSVISLLIRCRELAAFGALDSLNASGHGDSMALATLAAYILERYDRIKRRSGALDFNDLERGADRALNEPHVQEAFQKRFDLVLVDEFQDTNPLQARIILRFVRPDLSNLVVVGDPKQSIYRFRDADVSVFEDFCAKLPVNLSLTWNFRSVPGIIDYTNQVCSTAFAAAGMRYDGLVPKREPSDEEPVLRLNVKTPSDLAQWIRAENERGVPLHEMALLLRKIRGNEKWLKALTSAGIPIAVGSGGLFWEDPRVRELVSFLKWWANPSNSLAGGIFLRAPWVAVPDASLDAWVRRDPTWCVPFFSSDHPIARSLAPLRGKILRPGELLLALLVDEKIEDELGSALIGLWHRVEELSSRGLDFYAVIAEIARSAEEKRRERDVPPPRNQGQVSILTLHASKGLEFEHVILIDLGAKGRGPETPMLFWDRERGAFLAGRDADGDRLKKDPVEGAWKEDEKSKALAESMRIFYVALTRARERLVLVCTELPPEKSEFDPETAFDVDHWRGWVECSGVEIPVVDATAIRSLQERPATSSAEDSRSGRGRPSTPARSSRLKRPRHSVTEWTTLSRCPRNYEWTFVRPRAVADGIQELGLFTGKKIPSASETEVTQAELGTRVHACLENGDYDGLRALEAEVGSSRFLAEPVVSWAMSSAWMAPSGPDRDVWTELEFEIPVEGEILVGSIDRLVRQGDRFLLMDFKVTEKPKSVDALLEAYQTQMELYAHALRVLEPAVSPDRFEAVLINISSTQIQTVPIATGERDLRELALESAAIVAGEPGRPKPGPLCRFCEFRAHCPEGMGAPRR